MRYVDNPAHLDACIYGNRFPISAREDDEIMRVNILVDTSGLTAEQENDLICDVEEMCVEDYDYLDTFLEVEGIQQAEFVDEEANDYIYGLVKIYGYVVESDYDTLMEVLGNYEVDWKG